MYLKNYRHQGVVSECGISISIGDFYAIFLSLPVLVFSRIACDEFTMNPKK